MRGVRINGIDVTRVANWIDRDDWGDGPWIEEPDLVEWTDQATGYPCLIVREDTLGQLNGYVKIPQGHPFYGVDYTTLDDEDIAVHGGITFTGPRLAHVQVATGSKLPLVETFDDYWIGFDAAHHDDVVPGMDATLRRAGVVVPQPIPSMLDFLAKRLKKTYRDVGYMMAECAVLAMQLKDREVSP